MRRNENGPPGVGAPERAEKTGMQAGQDNQGDQMEPQEVIVSVTDQARAEQVTLDKLPTAFASLLAPCARRRRWAVSYRCPRCGGHHLGFAYTPDVSGVRRSGCGRKVWLVVARQYKGGHQ